MTKKSTLYFSLVIEPPGSDRAWLKYGICLGTDPHHRLSEHARFSSTLTARATATLLATVTVPSYAEAQTLETAIGRVVQARMPFRQDPYRGPRREWIPVPFNTSRAEGLDLARSLLDLAVADAEETAAKARARFKRFRQLASKMETR